MNPPSGSFHASSAQQNTGRPATRITAFAGILLIALLLPMLSLGVTIDGAGLELKNGGKLVVTATAPLPAAQLYTISLDLSGSASGDFENYLGAGTVNL